MLINTRYNIVSGLYHKTNKVGFSNQVMVQDAIEEVPRLRYDHLLRHVEKQMPLVAAELGAEGKLDLLGGFALMDGNIVTVGVVNPQLKPLQPKAVVKYQVRELDDELRSKLGVGQPLLFKPTFISMSPDVEEMEREEQLSKNTITVYYEANKMATERKLKRLGCKADSIKGFVVRGIDPVDGSKAVLLGAEGERRFGGDPVILHLARYKYDKLDKALANAFFNNGDPVEKIDI